MSLCGLTLVPESTHLNGSQAALALDFAALKLYLRFPRMFNINRLNCALALHARSNTEHQIAKLLTGDEPL